MKDDVLSYLKKVKIIYIVLSVLFIAVTVVFLFFASQGYIGFMILSVAAIILYVIFRIVYSLKFSMGTVYAVEVNGNQFTLKTPRKDFVYPLDCKMEIVVKDEKFIGCFELAGDKEKFFFPRKVPFSRHGEAQFTESDIRLFCPDFKLSKIKES